MALAELRLEKAEEEKHVHTCCNCFPLYRSLHLFDYIVSGY